MTKEEKLAQLKRYIEECWKNGATIRFSSKYCRHEGICKPYDGSNHLLWNEFNYFLESHCDFDLGI
jgi:hypothetical protein